MTANPDTIPIDSGSRKELLRVGDLARMTGKTVRAIHLYEELGLLHPTTRSSGGFRLYEPAVAERVRWIDLLHGLGFSLQEMREVLLKWWSSERGTEAMAELHELFTRKLDETRAAMARHRELERELVEGLAYLETCRDCESPGSVKVCVNCQQDHGDADAAALVVGLKTSAEPARRPARPAIVRVEDIAAS
jgi:DNA-binding transcriptional MerR regulator